MGATAAAVAEYFGSAAAAEGAGAAAAGGVAETAGVMGATAASGAGAGYAATAAGLAGAIGTGIGSVGEGWGALGTGAQTALASGAVTKMLSPGGRIQMPGVTPPGAMPDPLEQQKARERSVAEQFSRRGRAASIMTEPGGQKLGG